MPTELPVPQRPQRKSKNFLPEILVAGLLFGGGAWYWSQNLTPTVPAAPEMKAAQAQEAETQKAETQKAETQEAETPENWKSAPATEKQAAQKIIVAQLEAFKAYHYKTAEKYQASGLKQTFGSTEHFRQVIKQNYQQFANYKSVKWGKARSDGPMLQVQVVITGQDNVEIVALYSMVKENVGANGQEKLEYRVSGVSGGSEQVAPSQTV